MSGKDDAEPEAGEGSFRLHVKGCRTAEGRPLLSERERAELAGVAVPVSYMAADMAIYREDEQAAYVYYLESGVVRMSRALPHGARQVIAFMWPGDGFGLSELGRYVNTAETVTPVRAYRISAKDLERVLLGDAQLSMHLLVKGAHEMRAAQRHVVCLGQLDVQQRLARFLLDCADEHQAYEPQDGALALPMSRADIADYLGTSVETVARALTRLEREGVILRKGAKTLRLLRPDVLERLAEGLQKSGA